MIERPQYVKKIKKTDTPRLGIKKQMSSNFYTYDLS